jgi:hypothetical protein
MPHVLEDYVPDDSKDEITKKGLSADQEILKETKVDGLLFLKLACFGDCGDGEFGFKFFKVEDESSEHVST